MCAISEKIFLVAKENRNVAFEIRLKKLSFRKIINCIKRREKSVIHCHNNDGQSCSFISCLVFHKMSLFG